MVSTRDRGTQNRVSGRRAARLHAREQQRRREVRRRYTRWAVAAAVIVAIGAAVGFFVVQRVQSQPGKLVSIQGRDHINKGDRHVTYNAKPPTSGPHWNLPGEAPVSWGVYKEPIPDEAQLHNLEHGGVMIQYCRDCPDLASQLEEFYERWWPTNKLPLFPNSSKIVVAPYDGIQDGRRIALTGWGRIDTFDEYDEPRMIRFLEAWLNKGPEPVP